MGGKFLAPVVECYEICIIPADVKDYWLMHLKVLAIRIS
jgi:hypothetical protein